MTAQSWTDSNGIITVPTFRCGHPRTPENSWGAGGRDRCKQCCQARRRGERTPTSFKGDGVTTWKACAHPKTPENTWGRGKYPSCRECQMQRTRRYYYAGPLHPRKRVAARRDAERDAVHAADPAVALYRAEKMRKEASRPPTPVIMLEERRPMKMRLLIVKARAS